MIKNLYVGPVDYNWINDPRFDGIGLLTKKNLSRHLSSGEEKDFYTSIEDLDLKLGQMQKLIDSVGSIHLVGVEENFLFQKDQFDMYNWWNFVRLLNKFQIDKNMFASSHPARPDKETLFVVGCSVTAGAGVNDHQRYGDLLAQKLDMPYLLLAESGASIEWAADRILQSDLRKDDIVVWGLTSLNRVTISNKDHRDWKGYPPTTYPTIQSEFKYFSIDYLTSWTLCLSCVKKILQVENFCRKVGARLYLANLLETTLIPAMFARQKNYIDCIPPWHDEEFSQQSSANRLKWIDMGFDNDHPGPLQHQQYADQIYNHIKK